MFQSQRFPCTGTCANSLSAQTCLCHMHCAMTIGLPAACQLSPLFILVVPCSVQINHIVWPVRGFSWLTPPHSCRVRDLVLLSLPCRHVTSSTVTWEQVLTMDVLRTPCMSAECEKIQANKSAGYSI